MIEQLDAAHLLWSHPAILGEIRLGCGLPARHLAARIAACPMIPAVAAEAVLAAIASANLACAGLGWADVEILAACTLSKSRTVIYTRDRNLCAAAARLGLAFNA